MASFQERPPVADDGELTVDAIIEANTTITVDLLKNPDILKQLVSEHRIQVTSVVYFGSGENRTKKYTVSILPADAQLGLVNAPVSELDPSVLEFEAEGKTYSVQTLFVDEDLKQSIDRALKPKRNILGRLSGAIKRKRKK